MKGDMNVRGKAYVFDRDDIDTDMIIPAKYLNTDSPEELAQHAMEFIDPGFPKKASGMGVRVVVAGKNMGCGSSREHAVWCFTGLGIKAVVSDSFARIFFRNCINYGLLPVTCPGASKNIKTGDEIQIDMERGAVINVTRGREYAIRPLPVFAMDIVKSGGLLAHVKKKLEGGK
jgi:3-isopropylmalate/(R)-2-methylmalate dehydratase small subunit